MIILFFIFLGAWCVEHTVCEVEEVVLLPPTPPKDASVVAAKDADVMVVHFPRVGRAAYAIFRQDQWVVVTPPIMTNIYEGLKAQILAGYRLFPERMVEEVTTHKNFFLAGVREHISECQSFLSEDLEWWFSRIEELLAKNGSLSLSQEGRWKMMVTSVIKEKIYPEGKTRKWSVIPKKDVYRFSCRDRVCITFKDEPMALEGRLCQRVYNMALDPRSLLACQRIVAQREDFAQKDNAEEESFSDNKEAWWIASSRKKKGRPEATSSIAKPKLEAIDEGKEALMFQCNTVAFRPIFAENETFVEKFFSRILPTIDFPCGIGHASVHRGTDCDIYFWLFHAGVRYTVAANCSKLQVSMPIRCFGRICNGWSTVTNAFWRSFLRGFALKRPKRGCENVRLFTVPQVRTVVCEKQSFINAALQDVFRPVIRDLENCNSAGSKQTGMMFESLLSERQKILWSIEDRDTFLHDVLVEKKDRYVCSGTVLCLMRGEPAVLKGVPVSARYKDHSVKENLEYYWFEQVIAPKIMCAAESKKH